MPQTPDSPPDAARPWQAILALLTAAGIAFALMQTLVIPALPFFQREFGATASGVTWIATGFLLSSSVLTPLLGKLGDAYGKKRMLALALTVFGLGSLGAALAWSLGSLVAFRVLQGAGAAVFPLSFGIIRDQFPATKVGLGIGTVSSVFGAGGGIGLVMSGVILESLGWPWLFLIGGIPVLAAAGLIAVLVPESPASAPARPDYAGAAALSLALASLLLGISHGNAWGWGSAGVIGLLSASVLIFAVWARIERRVPEPMVDLAMLSHPKMAATNVITLLIGFSMFSTFISLPAFVQMPAGVPPALAERADYGFGASVLESGLFVLPSSLAMMILGPLAGSLGSRLGPVVPLRIGIGLAGSGLALFALFHDEPWNVYAWMALLGSGLAFAFASIGRLAVDNARAEETGVATGINTIMRTIGAAVGAQLAATIISASLLAGTTIPAESGFTAAFAMGAAGAAVALLTTLALTREESRSRARAVTEPELEPAS